MVPSKLTSLFSFVIYLQCSHHYQLLVAANTDVCVDTSMNIPAITTYRNKTYYLDVNNKMNWHNAYITCKQYNMELISIDSDAEFQYIREFINSLTTFNKIHVWTSGNDVGTEGVFKWMSNGQRVLSNRWHKGQPDNAYTNEDCMHFWHKANGYLFNDSNCDSTMAFICQNSKNSCCNNQKKSQFRKSDETC